MKFTRFVGETSLLSKFNFSVYGYWINLSLNRIEPVRNTMEHHKVALEIIRSTPTKPPIWFNPGSMFSVYEYMFMTGWCRTENLMFGNVFVINGNSKDIRIIIDRLIPILPRGLTKIEVAEINAVTPPTESSNGKYTEKLRIFKIPQEMENLYKYI